MRLRIEGRGPLVVKVAGLAGGVDLFREEVETALAAGYRVASLDHTGDRADDPARDPLSWELFGREVLAALDEAGARRGILWGSSFGCLSCLAGAARAPGRVSGLLLSFPPEPGSRPAHWIELLDWCCGRSSSDFAAAWLFHVAFVILNGWEFVAPTALARLPRLARAALDARTPDATIRQKLELLWRDDPGLPPRGIPATIIAGAWDTVAPLSGARRLAERLHDARLRTIPWGGHSSAYARPRLYHAWALEELARLSAGETSRG